MERGRNIRTEDLPGSVAGGEEKEKTGGGEEDDCDDSDETSENKEEILPQSLEFEMFDTTPIIPDSIHLLVKKNPH